MTEPLTFNTYQSASAALKQKELRQALYDEGAVVMQDVLVNLHGDDHKARRKLETRVFRRDFFRKYETEVFPTTVSQTIEPFLAAGRMDLVDFGYRVLVNLTADFTGIDRPLKSPEETADIMALLKLFAQTATVHHAKGDKDSVIEQARQTLQRFDATYVVPSIERRQKLLARFGSGELAEEDLPMDILTVLLRNEDGIDLPRDVLTRELAFFALAGAHTSIHSLTHAYHEAVTWVSENPEYRDRLKNDTSFLQRCALESIRLHPSSPIAARRSLWPFSMTGTDIEKGQSVVIDLQNANRDQSIFGDDAGEFNPVRQLPKNVTPWGLSFGQGMHACLGLNLAAGMLPKSAQPPEHKGTITLILASLFGHGAEPDPDDTPAKDASTARELWGYYPIRFK